MSDEGREGEGRGKGWTPTPDPLPPLLGRPNPATPLFIYVFLRHRLCCWLEAEEIY